jgi:hypothetical protein
MMKHKEIFVLLHIVMCKQFAWLIIIGSRFDDWVYWHFFRITVDYNSSHSELFLNVSEESLTNLRLISTTPLISLLLEFTKCTAFHNFHAAGIEITMLNVSSVVLLVVMGNLCLATCYLVTTLLSADMSQYHNVGKTFQIHISKHNNNVRENTITYIPCYFFNQSESY